MAGSPVPPCSVCTWVNGCRAVAVLVALDSSPCLVSSVAQCACVLPRLWPLGVPEGSGLRPLEAGVQGHAWLFVFDTELGFVAQTALELVGTLLPQPQEGWDDRRELPYPT